MRGNAVRQSGKMGGLRGLVGLASLVGCVGSAHAATITWDGGGGNLNWLTPANWSGDALPGPGDDVVIDAAGSVTITLAGSASVNSLSCADALTVSSDGTLTIATTANVTGLVTLNNGKLAGGAWTPAAGLAISGGTQGNLLNGLVLNGNATCPTNARITVQNGLTLNGTFAFTGSNPRLVFNGTQTLGGNATIQLTGVTNNPARLYIEGTSVVTLAPTVLVECGLAELGNFIQTSGVSALVNNGTIRTVSAGATTIVGEQFINNGTTEATAGTLTVAATAGTVNDGLLRALTSGSLVLAGPIAAADLGDVRNVSGSVLIQTTIDLLGGTLALDAVTGIWTFNGGGLTDGTLAIASGASPLFTSVNSTFTAMTVDGDLALGTNQRLWFTNGLTLNGTLAMTGSNPYLVANGTQTLGGDATIQLDGNNNNPARLMVEGTSTLTIAPTVVIEGSRGQVGLHLQTAGVSSVINRGTIRSDTGGTTFDLLGEHFINEGAIGSTAGTLRLSPSVSWSNTGTLASLGGTLRLEGATTLASFEGISNQGGTLQSAISLDLDGASYTIPNALSPLTFDGGSWSNGTLVIEPGTSVVFTSAPTTFDAMTVNGDLNLGSNQRLWFTNGLTINGTVSMTGFNAYLVANGTQTLGGNATILLDGNTNNPARIAVEGTSTLTIAPSVLIEGGWGVIGVAAQSGGVSSIINHATIRCDTANATFAIDGEQVVNNGTIECTAGTLRVSPSQTFVNAGTVSATAGSLIVQPTQSLSNSGLLRSNGGTLTVNGPVELADLGDVRNVAGTLLFKSSLDLDGAVFTLNGTTGIWTFDGASLIGGSLLIEPGSEPLFTSANNLFNAMTVNGTITLGGSGRLRYSNGLIMNGTLALTGANPYLIAVGTQTLGGNATIQLDGIINNPARLAVEGPATLTIAPTVTIEGGWASVGSNLQIGAASTVINLTTIRCDTGNASFTFDGTHFVNGGTVEVTAGTLTIATTQSWSNSGLIRSNGGTLGLLGPTTLADLGDVRNVAGTLLFKSTLTMNGGTLALNGTTGVWTFDGGTLIGGTLSTHPGGMPIFTTANSTFNAMTVQGNLALGTTQRLWFTNGLTLNGTLAMTGAGSSLIANGTQSLGGNALVQLDGPNNNPARIAVEGTSHLTIAPTVLIEGSGGSVGALFQNGAASSVLNQGTIRARTAAGQFTIVTVAGDAFTNEGTVEATNGNLLIVESATNLDAAGQLTGGVWKANNATLRFGTVAAGSPIRTLAAECILTARNGKILNLAALETIVASGVLRLNDGAVLNAVPASGTLVDNGFLFLNGTSTLTVTGGFTHGPSAILTAVTGAANQVLIDASEALLLDGLLQVANGPGYTPVAGDQVIIANGASRNGTFDTITTCEFADLFYTPNQAIYVYGEDTGVFADLNGDGFVGAADLALLLGSWGPCSDLCCNADLDASGDVGAPDIALLLGGWG